MVNTTCQKCGRTFEYERKPKGKPRLNCSDACRRLVIADNLRARLAAKMAARMADVKCRECGAAVVYGGVGTVPKFCNPLCARKFHNRKNNRARLPLMQPIARNCAHCGVEFTARSRDRIHCYDSWCGQAAYAKRKSVGVGRLVKPHDVTCDGCGVVFTGNHPSARWCSKQCANRYWGGVRARQRGAASAADYSDLEIFTRDNWMCRLCGEPVDRTVSRTHPDGATIDHTVPIARGGSDCAANVVTAHWRCNAAKGCRSA